ncbi:MAG: S-methyl-5-thioribose-1-phosphate isomerase [Deltaproteobacteria bacterium]|nr:S-methyl-5-thioribose-1-phosphate isomerase [Deltaproteobacteria bacterium]
MSRDERTSILPASTAKAVSWKEGKVVLLDQTVLPSSEVYVECTTSEEVMAAIKKLVVRGAPAIGIAGAYGVVLASQEVISLKHDQQLEVLDKKLKLLEAARPTAINLSWAISQLRQMILSWQKPISRDLLELLLMQAKKIHNDDLNANRQMAQLGSELLGQGSILTVCNTGDLATGGIGTAFGVLAYGYRLKKVDHVYACETRPVLQGMRLTAWELNRHQIPFTVICDNMAAPLMRSQKITAVIAGADRISANGDVANKIGTYSLAVLAKAHDIPFYVVAPRSTFDLSIKSVEEIPIEERGHEEVLSVLGDNRPPYEIPVWNPAFDVTPHHLISAIICERGVINYPNREKINELLVVRQT